MPRGGKGGRILNMKEGVVINKALKDKTHEALSSVLPVSLIILLLAMTVAPVSVETLLLFWPEPCSW